jgi:CheY-like chemotaxis protein
MMPRAATTPRAPRKVLVVDDDTVHLVLTQELLAAEGYDALVHSTAFGATEKVIRERPQVVLLDVNMPALSGEGLVAVLRARGLMATTKVLLYSSNDEEALRRAAERLGVLGYVCKGDPEELRRKLARVFAE